MRRTALAAVLIGMLTATAASGGEPGKAEFKLGERQYTFAVDFCAFDMGPAKLMLNGTEQLEGGQIRVLRVMVAEQPGKTQHSVVVQATRETIASNIEKTDAGWVFIDGPEKGESVEGPLVHIEGKRVSATGTFVLGGIEARVLGTGTLQAVCPDTD